MALKFLFFFFSTSLLVTTRHSHAQASAPIPLEGPIPAPAGTFPAYSPAPEAPPSCDNSLCCLQPCRDLCTQYRRKRPCMKVCTACCVKCKCVPPGPSSIGARCGQWNSVNMHGQIFRCP